MAASPLQVPGAKGREDEQSLLYGTEKNAQESWHGSRTSTPSFLSLGTRGGFLSASAGISSMKRKGSVPDLRRGVYQREEDEEDEDEAVRQSDEEIGTRDSSQALKREGITDTDSRVTSDPLLGLLYGAISSTCNVPSMVGYACIIFSHAGFDKGGLMPLLIKLVFFSALIHQLIMVLRSTLRFAVGQVQDAGLIFLSAMASSLVEKIDGSAASSSGASERAVSTVLACTAISTALVGIFLILTGYFRLAKLVQYLPLPVVAGYLSYIGMYCVEASLSLMTGGVQVEGFRLTFPEGMTWSRALILAAPGAAGAILLVTLQSTVRHYAVLPACILSMPAVFYAAVYASGHTLTEAQNFGFLDKPTPMVQFWDAFRLFKLDKVDWGLLPTQIPSWIGLFFVVTFGSTLDVAAIEMSLGRKLDYNKELTTIGLSNAISGVTGGFTGSYLFGQTTLIMKSGVHTRITGLFVVVIELAVFLVPFSVLQFIPRFLFGAVLCFIGLDIMLDWLFNSFRQIGRIEYIVLWLTLLACIIFGIEMGIFAGFLISSFTFILSYARAPACSAIVRPSGVMRPYNERVALTYLRPRILELRAFGYIFFGSSQQITSLVEKIFWEGPTLRENADDRYMSYHGLGVERSVQSVEPSGEEKMPFLKYIILDFKWVTGVDATAARSLTMLVQTVHYHGSEVLVAGAKHGVLDLLVAHGALKPEGEKEQETDMLRAKYFETSTAALQYAENALLNGEEAAFYAEYLGPVEGAQLMEQSDELQEIASAFFEEVEMSEGATVYAQGEWPEALYLVAEGEVTMTFDTMADRATLGSDRGRGTDALDIWSDDRLRQRERVVKVHKGVLGANDFLLRNPRSHTASISSPSATLYRLSAAQHHDLPRKAPKFSTIFSECLQKCLALEGLQLFWY